MFFGFNPDLLVCPFRSPQETPRMIFNISSSILSLHSMSFAFAYLSFFWAEGSEIFKSR